jgi:hypothetical protein
LYARATVFQWLVHYLHGGALELRRLVEEQDSVMGEAELAWRRIGCGAKERGASSI